DGAGGGLGADAVEEEEVDAGDGGDGEREDRDGAGVVERVERRGDQAVEEHLDPLVEAARAPEPAPGPGLRQGGPAREGGQLLASARRGELAGARRRRGGPLSLPPH